VKEPAPNKGAGSVHQFDPLPGPARPRTAAIRLGLADPEAPIHHDLRRGPSRGPRATLTNRSRFVIRRASGVPGAPRVLEAGLGGCCSGGPGRMGTPPLPGSIEKIGGDGMGALPGSEFDLACGG
jgi:hypothetical protein